MVTTKILVDRNLWSPGTGAERKKQFYARFEQSLERLQMDYVDMLMIHDVSNIEEVNDPYIIEAMQDLKDKGRIRFPAFSSHVYWPELLTAAADKGFYDVALLAFNYAMANDDASFKAMKYASEKGIGLIAMKTQCQQAWYKQGLPAESQQFYEGAIMHSALLKWVLNQDFITTAVPGFATFEQMQTDLEVGCDLNYTPEERTFLEDHNVKLALNSVCRFCGGCKGTCPHGVDIPSLMRTHMYALSYGNLHMTKNTMKNIEKGCGLETCSECNECVAQCRNNVQIASRLGELKEVMI
jgi:predicted aldo/keto reductase-like oxidoreductase